MFLLSGCLWLFSCYHGNGLSPTGPEAGEGAVIHGTVTFINAWPDSTREVRVVASREYPEGITDTDSLYSFIVNMFYTGNLALSDTLPRYQSSVDYELYLKPGNYAWALVVWFPDSDNYLMGAKELGAYYGEEGSSKMPLPVYIRPGGVLNNIDIVADLNNVYNEKPFFKR